LREASGVYLTLAFFVFVCAEYNTCEE